MKNAMIPTSAPTRSALWAPTALYTLSAIHAQIPPETVLASAFLSPVGPPPAAKWDAQPVKPAQASRCTEGNASVT